MNGSKFAQFDAEAVQSRRIKQAGGPIVNYRISLAMLIPTGFWSYTSSDNTSSQGKISKLRASLCDELQQQIGRDPKVSIFEDSTEIAPGREWENRIRQAIEASFFLIPIITPGFLQSEWCAREVDMFRRRENELGRSDLIFPIHYVDTSYVMGDDPMFCHDAGVLRFLRTRQWVDFRPLRQKNPGSEDVALKLEEIARAIATALRTAASPKRTHFFLRKFADLDSPARVSDGSKPGSQASEFDRLFQRNLLRYSFSPSAESREAPERILAQPEPPVAKPGEDAPRRRRVPTTFRAPTDFSAQPGVTVVKSGVVDGMAYLVYSDGSIEAQMPEGMMRFASIDELRSHVERP